MLLMRDGNGTPIQGIGRIATVQSAVLSTVAVSVSAAFTESVVRVAATTNCWLTIGTAPVTATNAMTYLPGGVVEYFHLGGGNSMSLIASGSGTAYITEIK